MESVEQKAVPFFPKRNSAQQKTSDLLLYQGNFSQLYRGNSFFYLGGQVAHQAGRELTVVDEAELILHNAQGITVRQIS